MTYSQINQPKGWGFSRNSEREQQGKDVFEYSVFGNPQTKIGDFSAI